MPNGGRSGEKEKWKVRKYAGMRRVWKKACAQRAQHVESGALRSHGQQQGA